MDRLAVTGRHAGDADWRGALPFILLVCLLPFWFIVGFIQALPRALRPWGMQLRVNGKVIEIPYAEIVPLDDMPALIAAKRAAALDRSP